MKSQAGEGAISFKARQRSFRHDAIIDAAQELMSRKGYAAMSIEDLIEAVGISKPTFYGHFPSKEELGVEVVLRMVQRARAQLATFVDTLPPGRAGAAMIAWTIEQQFLMNRKFEFSGSLVLFAHEQVIAAESLLTKELAEEFERGQQNGAVRNDVAPNFLARVLHSILKDPTHETAYRDGDVDIDGLKANVCRILLAASI